MPSQLLLPTIVLTTTGYRSGLERATALCAYRHDDGSWLVAATNFGRPQHPVWSTNLLRNPHGAVTVDGRTQSITATLLTAEKISQQRHYILRILPVYDCYAARAHRDIRVFLLTPADSARS